jgi:hypothetical protein
MRLCFSFAEKFTIVAGPIRATRKFHCAPMNYTYLPFNHPIIQRYQEGNMYTDNVQQQKEFELNDKLVNDQAEQFPDLNSKSSFPKGVTKSFIINANGISPVRQHLRAQSEEMMGAVFFLQKVILMQAFLVTFVKFYLIIISWLDL